MKLDPGSVTMNGGCSAAEISKYKAEPSLGRRIQCDNDVVQAQKYSFKKRNIKQDTRDDKLHQTPKQLWKDVPVSFFR
jgi:hypothetical protein